MEKIMSKTNDTERTRELTEAELDAVSGGFESQEHTTITPVAETSPTWGWRKLIVDGTLKSPVY
jgi:hypothetical protein